jgi:hypothetical protein
VNGKALVNGLQLVDMPASDMLDVIHYFFEDDLNYSTAEQAEARDKTRDSIYQELYHSSYKYSRKTSNGAYEPSQTDEVDTPEEKMPEPFNPAQRPKAYVAPTNVNADLQKPFGNVLDAPFQH